MGSEARRSTARSCRDTKVRPIIAMGANRRVFFMRRNKPGFSGSVSDKMSRGVVMKGSIVSKRR
jgi:hypothetical protein